MTPNPLPSPDSGPSGPADPLPVPAAAAAADAAGPVAPPPPPPPPGLQVAEIADYLARLGVIPAQPTAAERAAQERAQRLLVLGLIAAVFVVHLPWVGYLVAVFGCGGSFLDLCFEGGVGEGGAMLFARLAYAMLRVQAILTVDVARFSELMQVSTGVGAFVLAKIAAANGRIVAAGPRRYALAGACAAGFVLLFVAELHLTGSATYPVLGDMSVLDYIDFETPLDIPPEDVGPGLLRTLQGLRLADAIILGAALALLKSPKGP
jgi:hypothetical protein